MLYLRRAKWEDKHQILDISRTIWDGDDYIPYIVDKWIEDKQGEFTVAEVDGIIKGFAKFSVLSPGEFWLEGIRVAQDTRGKGIGKAITRYFIEKAKKNRYKTLNLSTYIENYESIKIIENNGFKKTTSFKFFYTNKKDNLSKVKDYKKASTFEEVMYILDSYEMKAANKYLSFDWTFMRASEELLRELLNEGSIYVLYENGKIVSTVILSDKIAKGNQLSISYISGEEYYLDGIRFALYKFTKEGYNALSFMCPDIEKVKECAKEVGMECFGDYKTDVFVYEYFEENI